MDVSFIGFSLIFWEIYWNLVLHSLWTLLTHEISINWWTQFTPIITFQLFERVASLILNTRKMNYFINFSNIINPCVVFINFILCSESIVNSLLKISSLFFLRLCMNSTQKFPCHANNQKLHKPDWKNKHNWSIPKCLFWF